MKIALRLLLLDAIKSLAIINMYASGATKYKATNTSNGLVSSAND